MTHSRAMRVLGRVTVLGLVLVGVSAAPASADPARPTDYRSTVTRVVPAQSAIQVKVVGGDGFLHLTVERGHTAQVLGYVGEPWLEILADGTVKENQESPATYLNLNRYAKIQPPPGVTDAHALNDPPDYTTVGHGGQYTWHDHRIHWMSHQHPPGRSAGDVIFPDWQVRIVVDGTNAVIHGTLVWEEPTQPALWFGIALAALALAVVAGRGKSVTVAAIAMVVAAVGALIAGSAEHANVPPAAGGSFLVVLLPAIGLAAAVLGVVAYRRPTGVVGVIASVAAVGSWAFFRFTVLLKPVLPTELNFAADRTFTAIALGFSFGAAVLAIRSGGLIAQLPDLDCPDAPAS